MPEIQSKSSEIISELNAFNARGSIDTISFRRIKKSIEKISRPAEKFMMLGMLYTLEDGDQATEYFERSLSLDCNEVAISNHIVSLGQLNRYSHACEKITKYTENCFEPELIKLGVFYSSAFLDFDKMHEHYEKASKMNLQEGLNIDAHKHEINVLESFINNGHLTKENMLEIGRSVFSVIEKLNVSIDRSSIEHDFGDDSRLELCYYIDKEISNDELFELHSNVIDSLIDKDLDLLPVSVLFLFSEKLQETSKGIDACQLAN